MPPIAFEPIQRVEGLLRPVQQFAGSQIAEIGRRQIGQQGHADIGRRGPGGDRGHGCFLNVVGRQPVFFCRDERFEIAPSPARQSAQKRALRGGQDGFARRERTADPPADTGRHQPEQQQWSADRQFGGLRQHHPREADDGKERRNPHLPQEVSQRGAAIALRILLGVPEHQATPGERHARSGNKDRIHMDHDAIGQRAQREPGFRQLAAQ